MRPYHPPWVEFLAALTGKLSPVSRLTEHSDGHWAVYDYTGPKHAQHFMFNKRGVM